MTTYPIYLGDNLHLTEELYKYGDLTQRKIERLLGRGAFGTVVSMWDIAHRQLLAVKAVTVSGTEEREYWPHLWHPNILPVLQIVDQGPYTFFVMPLMWTSLDVVLRSLPFRQHTKSLHYVRKWLHDVLQGLLYLHNRNLYHLDTKANNILLGEDLVASICDFTTLFYNDRNLSPNECKCPTIYRPPEIFTAADRRERNFVIEAKPIDIYHFGILIFECLTSFSLTKHMEHVMDPMWKQDVQPLFNYVLCENTFGKLIRHYYSSFQPVTDEDGMVYGELIRGLLREDPSMRSDLSVAAKSPFFQDLQDAEFTEGLDLTHLIDIPSVSDLKRLNGVSEHEVQPPAERPFLGRIGECFRSCSVHFGTSIMSFFSCCCRLEISSSVSATAMVHGTSYKLREELPDEPDDPQVLDTEL